MDPADLGRKIRAALEPRSLGRWPTPVEPAPALARHAGGREVWIKREDRSSAVYGGNKVRNLEFLLSGLAAGDAVLTVGGWGSTHCLAAARHARALGAHAVIAQFPQGSSECAVATAAATLRAASACFRARSWAGFPVAWISAWTAAGRLGPRRSIPGGGATPAGVVGHVLAVLELAVQLPTAPDRIVTPLGSGGTAAGILLGCGVLGWRTRVVAVRVAPRLVARGTRVNRLARAARVLLQDRGIRVPESARSATLAVVDGAGLGYGWPTPEGERARGWAREAGFETDSTYGGKALAMLAQGSGAGEGRTVFWHTYAAPEAG